MSRTYEEWMEFFKLNMTKFECMDKGYEERKITEDLKLTSEERFYTMLYLSGQMQEDGFLEMDKNIIEIRK